MEMRAKAAELRSKASQIRSAEARRGMASSAPRSSPSPPTRPTALQASASDGESMEGPSRGGRAEERENPATRWDAMLARLNKEQEVDEQLADFEAQEANLENELAHCTLKIQMLKTTLRQAA